MSPPLTLTQQVAENAATLGHHVPRISCAWCNGHGWIPLPPLLLAAWHALHPTEGRIAAEVGERISVSREVAHYRLNQLAGLGLARIAGSRPADSRRSKPAAEWVRGEGL